MLLSSVTDQDPFGTRAVPVKEDAETPAVVCSLLPHLHPACQRWRRTVVSTVENPTVGQLVLVICGESVVCSLLYLALGYFTATWRNRHSTSRPPNFSFPQHGMAAQAGPSNLGPVTGWVDQ